MAPALPLLSNPSYIYAQEDQAAQDQPQDQAGQESSSQSEDSSPEPLASSFLDEPQVSDQSDQNSPDSSTSESNNNTQPQNSDESESTDNDTENGQLTVGIVENSANAAINSDLLNPPESQSSAQLSTDQADYAPESTVKIAGSEFERDQVLIIKVTWPDGSFRASGNKVGETDQVTTDSSGDLYFEYHLTGGQPGEYKIEIIDAQGKVLATATFFDAKPTKPDQIATEPLSISSTEVSWRDKSNDEDDFHIERKLKSEPDSSFVEVGTVASITKTTTNTTYIFTDTDLACDTEYTYRVRAHRHDGSVDAFSDYTAKSDQKTLYWQTDSVFDLTPDIAVTGSTDVSILGFTMTSCKASAKIKSVKVEYTGDDKNDVSKMYLYRETGDVAGFDAGSDTLLVSANPPGGGGVEFNLNIPSDLSVGANSVTLYVVVDLSSTIGNKVDAKIKKEKIDIDPNNPSGVADNWPLEGEESMWDPEGETEITEELGSVSVTKYHDENANGVRDDGEESLDGWDINLSGDDYEGTQTTNGEGEDLSQTTFESLVPGAYLLSELTQDGWFLSNIACGDEIGDEFNVDDSNSHEIEVNAGETLYCEIGNYQNGQIVVQKTVVKPDGETEAEGDPGEFGFNIFDWDGFIDEFFSLSSGGEEIFEVRPGTYNVTEDLLENYDFVGCEAVYGDGSVGEIQENGELTIDSGDTVTVTCTNQQKVGSVSGLKFNDLNGDGILDEGEEGIEGWTIFIDANANGSLDEDETSTTTDENGNYIFEDLDPGTYTIREVLQALWAQTTENPEDITLLSGEDIEGVNFGNQEEAPPVISDQNTVNVGSAQVTFVWTTDIPATSRVIYDTVSHPGEAIPTGDVPLDKYGYAFTTGESDTGEDKTTDHTVVVCCFDQSTTYFYRTISRGSPEAQSGEKSFTTMATPPQSINPNSQGPGITTPSGPGPSGPSAPTTGGAVAGAFTQLGQVLGVTTQGDVLSEATSEATPSVTPSPSPSIDGEEEAKAFWQNWWWVILLILLSAGALWWFTKKSKDQK